MKKINAYLFVTLLVVVILFVCLILIRDTINRHHYEHFEQQTLEKTEQLVQANERLTKKVSSMALRLDSLQTHYQQDSTIWAQQMQIADRRLEQTRKQLDESVRKQSFKIPTLRRSTLDSL